MAVIGKQRVAKPAKRRLAYEQGLFLMAVAAGLPASVVALTLLWSGDHTPKVVWTLSMIIVVIWWACAFAVRERAVQSLRTLSNMLMAFREGDFSLRSARANRDGAYSEVLQEINAFGDVLRTQRLQAIEATALLRRVMAELDVPVFAFDGALRLRLANRACERLLGKPAAQLLGRTAAELGLGPCFDRESGSTVTLALPGGQGPWSIRRGVFRQGGLPHEFLMLLDLNRALRQKEREAWQRLVRVLGHEIRNSLTPIKSAAGTLHGILNQQPLPEDWHDDTTRVLTVIQSRADALNRFVTSYASLARLPAPSLKPTPIDPLVRRVARLETRQEVRITGGPDVVIQADPDQLEQVLINLVRNAVDATLETRGAVEVSWSVDDDSVEITICDEGPGIANPSNLFVPFFTTKPNGTGIGLVLSRQIAEAHSGSVTLENRPGGGCIARLRLPVMAPS